MGAVITITINIVNQPKKHLMSLMQGGLPQECPKFSVQSLFPVSNGNTMYDTTYLEWEGVPYDLRILGRILRIHKVSCVANILRDHHFIWNSKIREIRNPWIILYANVRVLPYLETKSIIQ